MRFRFEYIAFLLLLTLLSACTKEVDLNLPPVDSKIVVEGRIEQGLPPIVVLTRSVGFFEPTDIGAFESLFVHDAIVQVSDGTNSATLEEICSNDLPDTLLPIIAEVLSVSPEDLFNINYCFYTTTSPDLLGIVGRTYALDIAVEQEQLSAATRIPELVPLDSTWFKLFGENDTLGFTWARLSDPDSTGNAYRWFSKRINRYENGEQKDQRFFAPFGSVFNDDFFNGLSFDFAYNRGELPNSTKEDDNNDESGFFKLGDTIVVKFCSIDSRVYDFLRTFEIDVSNNGNPFGAPSNIQSNIDGGLGVWAGYGVTYDTIIANP